MLFRSRSAVDHPPGTGKAPGSNPGESIGATEFYEGARMVEPGFERLDRRSPRSEASRTVYRRFKSRTARSAGRTSRSLRRSLSPVRRHGVLLPSRRLRRRSVPASPLLRSYRSLQSIPRRPLWTLRVRSVPPGFAVPDSGTHEIITRPLLPIPYNPNEMRIASSISSI